MKLGCSAIMPVWECDPSNVSSGWSRASAGFCPELECRWETGPLHNDVHLRSQGATSLAAKIPLSRLSSPPEFWGWDLRKGGHEGAASASGGGSRISRRSRSVLSVGMGDQRYAEPGTEIEPCSCPLSGSSRLKFGTLNGQF